ncbi:MAG: ribosome recycling factor [Candidatus Omnitrophica bacterium CG07_land_8_20_14_0_80_50_8]|nr:MAG: ribosome recycling factor [Candidatus Omnitrophica bacterium CG07_land_8_20_14_0_80_50_8]
MDTAKAVLTDSEEKMKKSLDVVHRNFAGIRSGRANPGIVENLRVDYYGTLTPLKQLANIAVPEPKMLLINPWDASVLKSIEKAILESDIGIHPVVDGKTIRLVVPTLTRERREELVKIAHKIAEDGRVALRSIRRDANEHVKKIEKEKKITEDESFKGQADIQKLTDKYIQSIDQIQARKEKELSQV